METITDRYATPREAAAVLNRSLVTLERWRRLRQGPPFYRVAGRILYGRRELLSWVESHRQVPGGAA